MRIILIALLLCGCAETRYLTVEQDQELREACEPHGGCAVVPMPQWEIIEKMLQMMRGV